MTDAITQFENSLADLAITLVANSVAALGTSEAIANIQSISARADCTSPRGSYLTEIQSARGGRVWFKQTWADRNPYAIVINPQGAWATDTVTGETETLDDASVSMIRGHEFQMLALTIADRYSSPVVQDETAWNGALCYVVSALDDLNLPCTLYFRKNDSRWAGISLADSRRPGSGVNVVVNDWCKVQDVWLPSRVTATDSAGDFILDFTEITINNVDESIFRSPYNTDDVMGTPNRSSQTT